MKEAAVGNKTDRPISNWIHVFSTFKEIIDCLKIEFAIDDTRKKKLTCLLEKEICENLIEILCWHEKEGKILVDIHDGDFVRSEMQGSSKDSSLLNVEKLQRRYFWLWLMTCTCNKMLTRYIEQSIDSGLFLKYNNSSDKYEQTKLSQALWLLQKEIHFLQRLIDSSGKELFVKYDELKACSNRQVNIPNQELAILLSVSDRRYNIVGLSKAIMQAINGNTDFLGKFTPKPFSPFKDIEEELKKERPDEYSVRTWLLS